MTFVIRLSQMRALADAAPNTPVVQPCPSNVSWIGLVLVDEDGQPLAGEAFEIRLPDQSIRRGRLDEHGAARFDGITPGTASICFPDIDGREWAST